MVFLPPVATMSLAESKSSFYRFLVLPLLFTSLPLISVLTSIHFFFRSIVVAEENHHDRETTEWVRAVTV